jgi:hypothetical protein
LLLVVIMLVTAVYGTAVGAENGGRRRVAAASPSVRPTAQATIAPLQPSATARPIQVVVAAPRPVVSRTIPASGVFARVGGVPLVYPAARVERVGFHQASDVHSVNLTPAVAPRSALLPSRGRGTARHTAADIVVDPRSEIRAPVSGIVTRAGDYRLYCKYSDAFVVISPVGHPELQVKILHISGRRVHAGDRVVAGRTVIATRPTLFPFRSQIDSFTRSPRWPHVHVEATRLAVPSAVPVRGPNTLAFGRC